MRARVHRIDIPEGPPRTPGAAPTPALEAILHEPDTVRAGVVIAHPHPLFGGTMGNAVVGAIARAATDLDILALRFNFRGTGRSSGEYAGVPGGAEDVASAAARLKGELDARSPDSPLFLAGFSFGALSVGKALPAVDPDGVAFVGYPFRGDPALDLDRGFEGVRAWPRFPAPAQTFFVSGALDEFGPGGDLPAVLAEAGVAATTESFPDAGHMFDGLTHSLGALVAARLERMI